MKAEKQLKWIIGILVAFALLLILAESWVYFLFCFPGQYGATIGMALQNTAETLLFNPILPIGEIAENTAYIDSLRTSGRLLLHMSYVAMAVVPFIDLLIVFSVLDNFFHFFIGFSLQDKRILIVGYNGNVAKLIHGHTANKKIYLWTGSVLPDEEMRLLYAERIYVRSGAELPPEDRGDGSALRAEYDRFLRRKRITHVLIMNPSVTRNMQLYMELCGLPECRKRTIHFYVYSDDHTLSRMLEDCFDSELAARLEETDRGTQSPGTADMTDTCMDLRIFDMGQIQAQEMFAKLPLHKGIDPAGDRHVHLLILGDAPVREAILLQAMNQGVLSPDNPLVIDVVGRKTKELKERLLERFDLSYVKPVEKGFVIESPDADGLFRIRLIPCEMRSEDLAAVLKEGAGLSRGGRYTYLALCGETEDETMRSMAMLERINKEAGGAFFATVGIPVAARMEYSESVASYLTGGQYALCSELYMMGAGEEYLSIDHIIRDEEEKRIRRHNAFYGYTSSGLGLGEQTSFDILSGQADVRWNRQAYYRRESSRALYHHQRVKDELLYTEACEEELKRFREALRAGRDKAKEAGMHADRFCSDVLLRREGEKPLFPVLLSVAMTEHRRFVYFYASSGWGYAQKNDTIRRKHNCLYDWERLVEEQPQMAIYDLIAVLKDEEE